LVFDVQTTKEKPVAPVAGAQQNSQVTSEFICDLCSRSFDTKIGLGQHRRRAHKEAQHAEIAQAAANRTNVQWTDEELRLIALAEQELQGSRQVNKDLHVKFPHRSRDAISSLRKQPRYKAILANICSQSVPSIQSQAAAVQETQTPAPEQPESDEFKLWASNRLLAERLDTNCEGLLKAIAAGDKTSASLSINCLLDQLGKPKRPAQSRPDRPQAVPDDLVTNRTKRRSARRQAFQHMQFTYSKNRGLAAELCLTGDWQKPDASIPKDDLLQFWSKLFDSTPKRDPRPSSVPVSNPVHGSPFTIDEVECILRTTTPTAPGPDGLKLNDVKKIPLETIAAIFNGILLTGEVPNSFLVSRTVLIPKVKPPTGPGDFRPISISSALCRLFHKAIARRLEKTSGMAEVQRAFREIDGTAVNTLMLDSILDYAKTRPRQTHVCFIDVKKAFDSVSHDSIQRMVIKLGAPPSMARYLADYYKNGSTVICGEAVPIRNGVRQGDPLSPLLFNMVIDEALRAVEALGTGLQIDGVTIYGTGFADDIAFVASTKVGLQKAVDTALSTLKLSGLEANAAKCATISVVIRPKTKQWAIDPNPYILIDGEPVKALSIKDAYKYLGLQFSGKGITGECSEDLTRMLVNLKKAPLRPQQRLYLLRVHLIPKLLHRLVLSRVSGKLLKLMDNKIRAAVRDWLKLPHDTSRGFFHAAAADGGLGVPSMRTLVPRLQIDRLTRLKTVKEPEVLLLTKLAVYNKRLSSANKLSKQKGPQSHIRTRAAEKLFWKKKLAETCDGRGLANIDETPHVNDWVTNGTSVMKGNTFIKAIKIRGNLIETGERNCRGRQPPPPCPGGCAATDNLGHILQSCQRTHGAITERHNRVVAKLACMLKDKNHTVLEETPLKTRAGLRRPDIICKTDKEVHILDVQIVADANVAKKLSDAADRKATYYGSDEIKRLAAAAISAEDSIPVISSGIIWSWRGALCSASSTILTHLGVSRANQRLLTVINLEGSAAITNIIRKLTTRPNPNRIRAEDRRIANL
jgi:hypothetical protein